MPVSAATRAPLRLVPQTASRTAPEAHPAPCPDGPPALAPEALGANGARLLERVRFAARAARCERSLTLCEARRCALRPSAGEGALAALVRTMGEAIGRRPVFHAPGARRVSFDEAWLVRCHRARVDDDVDSLALLVRSRIAPHNRRAFVDLLRAI